MLRWPDPRLARPCAPVTDLEAARTLIADLFETMYAAPGRGLAAPQVGAMLRVFVMDAGWKRGEKTPRACIDPHVISASEATAMGEEGCLSVPGVAALVERPVSIVLGYRDAAGEARQVALEGAEARVAQHELDHLDGVMHFDRLGAAARDALLVEYGA
ncbi:peptide deformylase [Ponticoccus litoralis]|uniref:Peptide deformylase n=1 Tax=Ponticoccus litoralis TaxID=422297 RepID=A0AAW9SI18_9RHOB